MTIYNDKLTSLIAGEVAPATGCTEPVAIAYSVATAKKHAVGEVRNIEIYVSPNIYKNGYYVMIPGTKERGLLMGAALGFCAGDIKNGYRVIENSSKDSIECAKSLIRENKIKINIKKGMKYFFIETLLTTSEGMVRVVTTEKHLNIVDIKVGPDLKPVSVSKKKINDKSDFNNYSLEDYHAYIEKVPIADLEFLTEGLDMNYAIAQEGIAEYPKGIGRTFQNMIENNILPDHVTTYAQLLCSAASEARMLGSNLPVMSVSGSGNVGITVFLINYAVAKKYNIPNDTLLRSLALSILVLAHVKSHIGSLSTMCSCGIAAGLGASVGATYMLGGNIEDMYGAMLNLFGSITGIICDGAKEGCAYKLALSAGWSIQCALLSMNGATIDPQNGVLSPVFDELIYNVSQVCDPGMAKVDSVILDVITKNNSLA